MARQPGGAGGDNARVGAQAWEIGEAEELEAIASLAGGVNDRDRGVPQARTRSPPARAAVR